MRHVTLVRCSFARRRVIAVAVLTLSVLLHVPPLGGNSANARMGASAGAEFSKDDMQVIREAATRGGTVDLVMAAETGRATALAEAVAKAAGSAPTVDTDVDYVRATVPASRVAELARSAAVAAVMVDRPLAIEDPPMVPAGWVGPTPYPVPGPDTPRANPYMPTQDTGAAQFVNDHPTWDGRGVTIAVIDSGVDVWHPAFSKTSTGQDKIVDWFSTTRPRFVDPTWVSMDADVSGPTFMAGGVPYVAPGQGAYRFGLFDERHPMLEDADNDVNRDGNPSGSSGLFGVLWDNERNEVWVDTDQDRSFADERTMTDYRVRHDKNLFGRDDPATTEIVEEVAFVVQTDGRNRAVSIGLGERHGTHVAGIAAANDLFGGEMDGAAPGASLVAVRVCVKANLCMPSSMAEGAIAAAKRGDVDVVNMSLGTFQLNDGQRPLDLLINRLTDKYKVQFFIAAHNDGSGMSTVRGPSTASRAISVGSYTSAATYRSNYGAESPYADNISPWSSRGPRQDGGFKPDLLAPGSAISTFTAWCGCGAFPGLYDLPPGYAFADGTSMATPQAAGAAALLISAARQTGVQHQPEQLRHALTSTARFLDSSRIGAYEQGNGLIQVAAAWELLQQRPRPVEVTSTVPISTHVSHLLTRPNMGTGIFDRRDVVSGQSYTRRYTFTRRSGSSRPITYRIEWLGNDGTFRSPATVTLGLNTPVTFDVVVNPSSPGAHSAILNLDDPATAGRDHQTMNVVVVPHELDAANSWTLTVGGTLGRHQATSVFVRVPRDLGGLAVSFSGPSSEPGTGQARFLRYQPSGLPLDDNRFDSCYLPTFVSLKPSGRLVEGTCDSHAAPRTPSFAAVSNPAAGVWELGIDASRNSDVLETRWTMTVQAAGVTIDPDVDVIPAQGSLDGSEVTRNYRVTNLAGAFTGQASGSPLASARRGRYTISNGQSQTYPVDVRPGTTSLRAAIGGSSDVFDDLDLYVYDCHTGPCQLAAWSADADSDEAASVNQPSAGRWMIEVHAYSLAAETTTYGYTDELVHPSLGSVEVNDAPALRAARPAGWDVTARINALATPEPSRVLLGHVRVVNDARLELGSNDIVVG